MILLVISWFVAYPFMISTNFIIGTGFMKCIPITLSGRDVTDAIFVIEIEDVFEARIQLAGAFSSTCLKISSLRARFSIAASTTRSAFLTEVANEVCVTIFLSADSFASDVIAFLLTWRSRFLVMVATALFSWS